MFSLYIPLFSAVHGDSFMKLSKSIDGMGASIILVKSRRQHVFGAFASLGFVSGPTFVGDERSFLFAIEPEFRIHHATGYNSNFAYLNSNQKTIPNGLVCELSILLSYFFQSDPMGYVS